MARELVGLKFHAGLHTEDNKARNWKKGHAKYLDFNLLDPTVRSDMDWSSFIDAYGIGMQYDKACGHKQEGDSPFGQQCCVIAVPNDFAKAALAQFPGEITEMTPVEFEAFYNDKAHAHELAENVDKDVLDAIKAKEDLGLAVPEKTDAIDPKTEARGIRKNHNKVFADFKVKAGVNIVASK